MANFPSSLSGQQLNDALRQVEARIPEGWAVGTNNGVPVSSGSPYYNNNAKYYAAIAQAAIPSGTAGAVFFDRAQSLTAVQQAQARANMAAGGSNDNALDNWWFATGVINQQGNTTGVFSGDPRIVDRWFAYNNSGGANITWTVTSNGIKITANGDGTASLQQSNTGRLASLVGKQIVTSILMSDGTIYKTSPYTRGTWAQTSYAGPFTCVMTAGHIFRLQFNQSVAGQTIKAIKIEVGTYSTLANDMAPDPSEQLEKCQQEFIRITTPTTKNPIAVGFANATTQARFLIPTPVSMRAKPSITSNGTFYLEGNGGSYQVTSFASSAAVFLGANGIFWAANASGLTISQVYMLASDGGYIDLSTGA